MKKLIYIPLFIVLVLFGYIFHTQNLGSLLMSISSLKAKTQARGYRKKLEKVEKEVENLRALPIKNEL